MTDWGVWMEQKYSESGILCVVLKDNDMVGNSGRMTELRQSDMK